MKRCTVCTCTLACRRSFPSLVTDRAPFASSTQELHSETCPFGPLPSSELRARAAPLTSPRAYRKAELMYFSTGGDERGAAMAAMEPTALHPCTQLRLFGELVLNGLHLCGRLEEQLAEWNRSEMLEAGGNRRDQYGRMAIARIALVALHEDFRREAPLEQRRSARKGTTAVTNRSTTKRPAPAFPPSRHCQRSG